MRPPSQTTHSQRTSRNQTLAHDSQADGGGKVEGKDRQEEAPSEHTTALVYADAGEAGPWASLLAQQREEHNHKEASQQTQVHRRCGWALFEKCDAKGQGQGCGRLPYITMTIEMIVAIRIDCT